VHLSENNSSRRSYDDWSDDDDDDDDDIERDRSPVFSKVKLSPLLPLALSLSLSPLDFEFFYSPIVIFNCAYPLITIRHIPEFSRPCLAEEMKRMVHKV
jgi:hypothetical protein